MPTSLGGIRNDKHSGEVLQKTHRRNRQKGPLKAALGIPRLSLLPRTNPAAQHEMCFEIMTRPPLTSCSAKLEKDHVRHRWCCLVYTSCNSWARCRGVRTDTLKPICGIIAGSHCIVYCLCTSIARGDSDVRAPCAGPETAKHTISKTFQNVI